MLITTPFAGSPRNHVVSVDGGAYTQEHKDSISRALKGRHVTLEHREILRKSRLGKKASKETKQKLSKMRKGCNNAFYGKKHKDCVKKLIGSKSVNRNWACGSRAASWIKIDDALIIKLYFKKLSFPNIRAEYQEITGQKIGYKLLKKAFKAYNIPTFIEHRGFKAIQLHHNYIDNNSLEDILNKKLKKS